MAITVAPLQKCHTQALAGLCVRMHMESKYKDMPYDATVVAELIEEWLVGDTHRCFIALQDDKPIGFIAVYLTYYYFNNLPFVTDLAFYVDRAYRHTTAAIRLLTAAKVWAKSQDAAAIHLGITASHDPESTGRLYEKAGYAPWGVMYRIEV